MVAQQIKPRGVTSPEVLRAMREVPRQAFVPEEWRKEAYGDYPIPIGGGQTISQPYVVAAMTEALELDSQSRVLEIGTGSGYQTALLAEIAAEVHTIECRPELSEGARRVLAACGYRNIHFHVGDGAEGWPPAALYDAIISTCAPTALPQPWTTQLRDGGRIVAPIGDRGDQRLLRWIKIGESLQEAFLMNVRFVPLV